MSDNRRWLRLTAIVAEREIRQRVRSRAFTVSTIVLLLVVGAAVTIPAILANHAKPQQVGIVGGQAVALTEILAEQARAGVTVLFSSHQLDLVEHICESVAIIHRGRVVAQGAVSDLERGERTRLAVRVAGDQAGDWARQLDQQVASVEQVNTGTVLRALAPGADSQRVLDTARAAGAVEHFSFASRRLSEVFRDVTGEDA